ncbi:MAG: protein-L-isoaspartate(D-aspartate) O-methyltransferase [Gammaproteobacteria bacterium]|nr:protein-L-isoaspartate(D-aspartate) O-methyltransferase [Gammaproteobacteria bacterium]
MTSQRTRDRMVSRLKEQGIQDQRVLSVMREVPRHCFVEEALASRAYEDTALPIGHGQTISQPYIVARMTEVLLQTQPMQQVLEVGTGSGYQAAILSRLVRHLQSVERIMALSDQARYRFRQLKLRNIRLRHSDGGMGMPDYAPYDGIIVTAAPEGIPHALVKQLRPGGVIIMPIGDSEEQILIRVTRTEEGYEKEFLERVSFVPLLGGVT